MRRGELNNSEKQSSSLEEGEGRPFLPHVAFMGMLYLVYLVECYHSPIRIDLLHADSVLTKLSQLRLAQPTIWWKAISYHYVRRKRQITRYRNGDNYTTTQVYYERVNTHAATSHYFYDYCGVKDISKDLIIDPRIPITKITLTKGFAFSNMRSATEFEEARSRFFAEQELRDDYMEMREGLDLGYNFNTTSLVAVLGNPWFTNCYVYWCLSALLLSWPLRIIIECNTQYADYQITKIFGVNYDTPLDGEPIHASSSQLSAPGSYMLAPSYSEALLMEPSVGPDQNQETEMVPSYSEALLYERAQEMTPCEIVVENPETEEAPTINCGCPCHGMDSESCRSYRSLPDNAELSDERSSADPRERLEESADEMERAPQSVVYNVDTTEEEPTSSDRLATRPSRSNDCTNCKESARQLAFGPEASSRPVGHVRQSSLEGLQDRRPERKSIPREISEPNLRSSSELMTASTQFLMANGRSLENILEKEEADAEGLRTNPEGLRANQERAEALVLEDEALLDSKSVPSLNWSQSRGAIPKRVEISKRVTVNPMSDVGKKIPSSRTYFCLKSILKQNKRRYTLVTADELQSLAAEEHDRCGFALKKPLPTFGPGQSLGPGCSRDCCGIVNGDKFRLNWSSRESLDSLSAPRRKQLLRENGVYRRDHRAMDQKRENSRTLIFASPIQEVCPEDPFGGKNLVPSENPPDYEEALNFPALSRLRRSFTEREVLERSGNCRKHQRTLSVEPEDLFPGRYRLADTANHYRNVVSFPQYEGRVSSRDARILVPSNNRLPVDHNASTQDQTRVFVHASDLAEHSADPRSDPSRERLSKLRRSLTERRSTSKSRRADRHLRRSFTERVEFACGTGTGRRTNLNMETSL
ncbi:uncharacterized protein LOC111673860 [Orussus abietinus]|uniref:uncharacterized protein LOC111673860 n=1 Tax=Orussus abietinus TaxID=222816 RepID=UPI000C7161F9|nr:uncharacterized protein LOC111673860 [Orussus abietinus]